MDSGAVIALITLLVTVVVTASAGIRYLIEISLKIQHFSLITQQGLEKLGVQMAMTDNEIKRETEELKEKIRYLEKKIQSQENDLNYVKKIIEQVLPGKFNRKTDFSS